MNESIAEKVAHVRASVGQPHRHHECHADGCKRQVPPAMFMCSSHWYMVPQSLRARIWDLYRKAQEERAVELHEEYIATAIEAIAAVKEREAEAAARREPSTRTSADGSRAVDQRGRNRATPREVSAHHPTLRREPHMQTTDQKTGPMNQTGNHDPDRHVKWDIAYDAAGNAFDADSGEELLAEQVQARLAMTAAAFAESKKNRSVLDHIVNMSVADETLPSFETVVVEAGHSSTDGGFFPVTKGNQFVGKVLRVDETQSEYGTPKEVDLGNGQKTTVKMQLVYVVRGTARILTQQGMQTVAGNFKIQQHERLKTAMVPYVNDPNLIFILTCLGQEQPKTKTKGAKAGEQRDGAHLYDVQRGKQARA